MLHKTINVQLESCQYPIYIGHDILTQSELWPRHIAGQQIFIVSNQTVVRHYGDHLRQPLQEYNVDLFSIPDGEQYKTLATWEIILEELLQKKHDRKTTLIALGGGVIGDITGFAANCYRRGVPFIQVPTTLLAQVDAAIGGKTGVNHPLGKNMIGTFYQPQAVYVDTATLNTLPVREFKAGLAEVIKYALIKDAPFFDWLEKNSEGILDLNPNLLLEMISRSIFHKVTIVQNDVHEQGERALLNFGHTFAHVIESMTNYTTYLHGEAVAIGLVLAAEFSAALRLIGKSEVLRIKNLLQRFGLPIHLQVPMTADDFYAAMQHDKKVLNQTLRLVLLDGIGSARVVQDFDHVLLKSTLSNVLSAPPIDA